MLTHDGRIKNCGTDLTRRDVMVFYFISLWSARFISVGGFLTVTNMLHEGHLYQPCRFMYCNCFQKLSFLLCCSSV